MTQPLWIAVADDEAVMLRWYENTLTKFGHQVIFAAKDGRDGRSRIGRAVRAAQS